MIDYNPRVYYQYIVTQKPESLAVTLSYVKEQLRLPEMNKLEDPLLASYIKSAMKTAEKYTGRILITTTFNTFRDCFDYPIVIRKSPLQEVISMKYYTDGVLTTLDPSNYYATQSNDYSKIFFTQTAQIPNVDLRAQSIVINFTAGYGDDFRAIPDDIQLAIVNHVTKIYSSRGDCGCDDAQALSALPVQSKLTYNQYKIYNINAEESRG